MVTQRISTIAAHVILAISSCWVWQNLYFEIGYAGVGMFLYFATGVMGIIVYGLEDIGNTSYKVYSNLWLYSLAFGLPSISSQLYIISNFCTGITVLHFLPPSLFVASNPFFKRTQFCLLETIQSIYLLAVGYISFLNYSYYGFALVTSYAIAFYAIGSTGTIQNTPAKDLLSFSLAFSNFFTVRTLRGM